MRHYISSGIVLWVLGATVCLTADQSVSADVAARLDRVVRQYVDENAFSGSILASRGKEVLLARGYGLRDRAQELPNQPDSLFEIASLSKPITAAAVLLLHDDGRLDVHDQLAKHLPELPAELADLQLQSFRIHVESTVRG